MFKSSRWQKPLILMTVGVMTVCGSFLWAVVAGLLFGIPGPEDSAREKASIAFGADLFLLAGLLGTGLFCTGLTLAIWRLVLPKKKPSMRVSNRARENTAA